MADVEHGTVHGWTTLELKVAYDFEQETIVNWTAKFSVNTKSVSLTNQKSKIF